MEAMMNADVDDDTTFTPIVTFTPDLSGIECLSNSLEFYEDINLLQK